jgi:integrase
LVVSLPTLKRKRGIETRKIPIPLSDPLLYYLQEWLKYIKPGQPIFHSYHNPDKPLDRTAAWRIIKKASPNLWCHLLRHTRLTEMATRMTAFELQQFAGWSDVRPAQDYIYLDWKQLARKMESDEL